ncbi:MAG: GlsB/YeaQ/YmgE family stress response membrane protein [bacterium]
MEFYGFFGALFVGVIIGLIARLLVPSMQPIGCLMTIICGVIGAYVGLWLGAVVFDRGWGFDWLTLILQILVAVVLVAIVAALFRRSSVD